MLSQDYATIINQILVNLNTFQIDLFLYLSVLDQIKIPFNNIK